MKIFSVSQIRKADEYTIVNEPILSLDLMERAARACYYWFHTNISRQKSIAIYCGKGNNGGDGLALARMLKRAGYNVLVFIVEHSSNASEDFQENFNRLKKSTISVTHLSKIEDLELEQCDIIVDAILGSGLKSPLNGFLKEVVLALNAASSSKISIDIPTGLFADYNKENNLSGIFKADFTLTFQFPKRSFLFPEFGNFVGDFNLLDIGLHPDFIRQTATNNFYIDNDFVQPLLKKRSKFNHKGTFGHAFIIAGSEGKIGAAILASRAALKSGAGLVTAYLPKIGLLPMQVANPEIMLIQDQGNLFLENILVDRNYSAIGIGPGIGTHTSTIKTLIEFLEKTRQPVVLDADALNILAQEDAWEIVPPESILTPHLGELDRMFGKKLRGENLYDAAQIFAQKRNLNLLVKGAHTAVYTPEGNVYFNSTGCNGMATAGSGDVLTGTLTGLLAQGLTPLSAAIVGVYFHGLAGESAANIHGNAGMLASDIITNIRIGE